MIRRDSEQIRSASLFSKLSLSAQVVPMTGVPWAASTKSSVMTSSSLAFRTHWICGNRRKAPKVVLFRAPMA